MRTMLVRGGAVGAALVLGVFATAGAANAAIFVDGCDGGTYWFVTHNDDGGVGYGEIENSVKC